MAVNQWEQSERLANMRQNKASQLDALFWTQVAKLIKDDSGSIDVKNKNITFPTSSLPSQDNLWNSYLDIAKQQGVTPNYTHFAQNYQAFKSEDDKKIANLISTAENLGFSKKNIRKSLKNNPENQLLETLITSGDPELQALYSDYLTDSKGFWKTWGDRMPWSDNFQEQLKEWADENPNQAGALLGGTAYGGYRLGKYGVDKGREWWAGRGKPPVDESELLKGWKGPRESTLAKKYAEYIARMKHENPGSDNILSKEAFYERERQKSKANYLDKKKKTTTKPKGKGFLGRTKNFFRSANPWINALFLGSMLLGNNEE